jgi:hypothetical protein
MEWGVRPWGTGLGHKISVADKAGATGSGIRALSLGIERQKTAAVQDACAKALLECASPLALWPTNLPLRRSLEIVPRHGR